MWKKSVFQDFQYIFCDTTSFFFNHLCLTFSFGQASDAYNYNKKAPEFFLCEKHDDLVACPVCNSRFD